MNYRIHTLFLFGILFLLAACKSDSKKDEGPTIDPKDIIIDIQVGGVPTADGQLLSFKRSGKGKEMMLVPGSVYLADDLKALAGRYSMIFYDGRNRGRSSAARSAKSLEGGIQKDVADLEQMRAFFKLDQFSTIGFGYYALVVAEYAKQYPNRIKNIVLLSPFAPEADKFEVYRDNISGTVATAIKILAQAKDTLSKSAYCDQWWAQQRKLFVAEPDNAVRTFSSVCQYPNEQPNVRMQHWNEYLKPSIAELSFAKADFEGLSAKTLILHGNKDRIAPLDGAKAWEELLPNAALTVLEGAGHVAWMDKQGLVFDAVQQFLQE